MGASFLLVHWPFVDLGGCHFLIFCDPSMVCFCVQTHISLAWTWQLFPRAWISALRTLASCSSMVFPDKMMSSTLTDNPLVPSNASSMHLWNSSCFQIRPNGMFLNLYWPYCMLNIVNWGKSSSRMWVQYPRWTSNIAKNLAAECFNIALSNVGIGWWGLLIALFKSCGSTGWPSRWSHLLGSGVSKTGLWKRYLEKTVLHWGLKYLLNLFKYTSILSFSSAAVVKVLKMSRPLFPIHISR